MITRDRSVGSLTIARAVSGPYRPRRARRASVLTTAGVILLAVPVIATVAAMVISCV
jgi:hypothetical protein